MVLRLASPASRSYPRRLVTPNIRRSYSTKDGSLRFTVDLSSNEKDLPSLLASIKSQVKVSNPSRHDAAVILATPQYAKWLDNEAFLKDFVSLISGSEKPDQFHVLSAVVDHVAPPVPRNKPIRGLSVLRGSLDSILPDLWTPEIPGAVEDADKVAALTVNLGNPHLTIPLANTTFLNHRTSTLIAHRFNLKPEHSLIAERIEKRWQQISPPLDNMLKSVNELGIWAPLVPLTRPRVVTESFGNIVRRVDVDNESTPASNELELAVDELHKTKSYLVQTSMGVWAMISPPSYSHSAINPSSSSQPNPAATGEENHSASELVSSTSGCIQQLYRQGGRLYQILSGGGGWGAKKGLLSLDPQRTHFALSEEEEMQRFIQAMDGGNFVPVGSKIQFFASTETPVEAKDESSLGIVFGTAGLSPPVEEEPIAGNAAVIDGLFGALSNSGIFVTSSDAAAETTPGYNNDWRLNVPHSRVFMR